MRYLAVFATVVFLAMPLAAQTPTSMVTAGDPQGMVRVLEGAGYRPVLGKDDTGDPRIDVELDGSPAYILFYGCDEDTHQGCNSIQFAAGFDRTQPWTAEAALSLSQKYRFTSMSLDEEGDPFVKWDVMTGNGIPSDVFLAGVNSFRGAMDIVSEAAFADSPDGK